MGRSKKHQGIIIKQDPRTLIVGINSPNNATDDIESYFEEFANLVSSNGIDYHYSIFFKIRSIVAATFIPRGKLNELAALIKEHEIEQLVISEPLSAQQERNISTLLGIPLIDRTLLILQIFEKGAQSAEGKTQVELAMLHWKKSRLAGYGVWLAQQAGRIGTKGPGETLKEREMRHINRRITHLKQDLVKLQKQRDLHRKKRIGAGILRVSLVGYTNAGKSTILNQLTKAGVRAEHKLFATLDTTTRKLFIDGELNCLISDTVGFIQQIPHTLIDAFKSTLLELDHAHLLLHVIDSSDPNWESHIAVVEDVLEEIDVNKPTLYLFSKADKRDSHEIDSSLFAYYQPYLSISALSKEGIRPLLDFFRNWFPPGMKRS